MEVAEASNYLRTHVIPMVVKKLEALEIIPVDSPSLTQVLHLHGINIRYLGLIYHQSTLPHVKEICLIEMIARASKKILNAQMALITLHSRKEEHVNAAGIKRTICIN